MPTIRKQYMETAILLMNLGSPDSPVTKDLKPYLTEFLMDERVIDIPRWIRSVLVKGIIVPTRSPKSAEKYRHIWTKEGSPLIVHTKNLVALVQERFKEPVYYSMRYGKPETKLVLEQLHKDNPDLKELLVLPLYPHYAMSSYETAIVQAEELHKKGGYTSKIKTVAPFYNNKEYIAALSNAIRPYVNDSVDHVLFSYHGIPERHVRKTDCTGAHCLKVDDCCTVASDAHAYCYRHQVITTTNLVAEQLGLKNSKFSYSFQSRLGADAWLKPYSVKQFVEFPKMGIKNLLILCPAFVSDCLETLEEIEMEGKDLFLANGGTSLTMVPALNENKDWVDCVEGMLRKLKSSGTVVL